MNPKRNEKTKSPSGHNGSAKNLTEIKYEFEKSPKPKGRCPSCGHERQFRYYEGLPREYGKCERIINCNYHRKPDTSELKAAGFDVDLYNTNKKPKEALKIVYPTFDQLQCLNNLGSTFHLFLIEKLLIPKDHLQKWKVGSDGSATKFVYSRAVDKPVNIVTIQYDLTNEGSDCKRNKKNPPYSLKANKGTKYELCLFGEHLLTDKIICLVESEKTAVIASFHYPQFDWLATGGANKLTDEKMSVLFNREIYYLNDADKAGKENSTIKKLRAYKQNFKIIDLFPDRNDGHDLADAIINGSVPAIVEQPTTANNRDEAELVTQSLNEWGFYEKNFQYWQRIRKIDESISNFTMKLLYTFPDGTNNSPFLFELHRKDCNPRLLEIRAQELVKFNSLKGAFMSVGNYMFYGHAHVMMKIIGRLREKEIEAVYLNILGQQAGESFFAFSNGIILSTGEFVGCNELGVVEHSGKHYYIPAASQANNNNENYDEDRKFKFSAGIISLHEYCKRIYEIYNADGLIGLCYLIGAIHRDKIFSTTKCFPFLFLFGEKGKGKTTFIDIFRYVYGEPQKELTDKSTEKAILRMLAQTNNAIVYGKEWSREFDEKAGNILKSAYDGTGYSRAKQSNDLQTTTTKINSAAIFDGNNFPLTDDALFSRLIFMVWSPTFTNESKNLIDELFDKLKLGGGLVFTEIYKKGDEIKNHFQAIFRTKMDELRQEVQGKNMHVEERDLAHINILLTLYDIVLKPLSKNEAGYDNLKGKLLSQTINQSRITAGLDVINDFFETLSQLKNETDPKYYISEGTHFVREVKDFIPAGCELLVLAINDCYGRYSQFKKSVHNTTVPTQVAIKERLNQHQCREYPNVKSGEKEFNKKFAGNAKKAMVFIVKAGTFELNR